MRRTYRSKKDAGGALDHRDVLLNMDEKSSAFDAFYIQNIKHTKRELSCVTSSNQAGITSTKVRKRKYVKRLVKDVEPVRQRETLSTSAYLTPDKSIRVNKILDPFDMLLNSSPAPQETFKPKIIETLGQKKESKAYVRKRKPKIKKLNYSSTDSTASDKENTIDSNVTDIRNHELLIEKVPNKISKCVDESINKIISNLSLINNLKCNGSFKTSYKTRNRLTKNYQSPILQKSPYCSTPFKEKYRGVSIFKFSPIVQKEQMNSTWEDKDESNRSIILVSKSLARKSSNEHKVSPLAQIPLITKNKTNLSTNDNKDNSSIIVPEDKVQNEEVFNSKKQSNNSTSNNDQSSCQITDAEPFLGFSNNSADEFFKKKMDMLECLKTQSIHEGNETDISHYNESLHTDADQNKLATKQNYPNHSLSIMNADDNKLVTNRSDYENSSLHDTSENDLETEKIGSDGSLSYIDTNENDSENSSNLSIDRNETEVKKDDSKNVSANISIDRKVTEINKHYSSDSSSIDFAQSEIESNNSSRGESKITTNSSIDSNKCNTSESNACSQSSDSESLYDTCDSNQSCILEDDDNIPKKEPVIVIEKMNDSIFLKYYAKMLELQNDEINEQTDNDDFESLANDSNEAMMDQSRSENSDPGQIKAIVITDSSTTDDVAEEFQTNDENSNNIEERYVSFVTTRRRNEITKDSMFQFDQSYASSSTDCDKTVLSIKVDKVKSDNIGIKYILEDDLNKANAKGNSNAIKTHTAQDKRLPRKSTRKSRLSNKSNAISPKLQHDSHDSKSKNSANEMSMINTRRCSRIASQRKTKNRNISNCDVEMSDIAYDKIKVRITTRKHSRLPRLSHYTSPEVDNIEKELTFRSSEEIDKTVVDNKTSEKDSNDFENRNSISSLQAEHVSTTLKENIVNHPERSSFADVDVKPAIVLHPGKKWERSLSIYRRMTMVADHLDQSVLEDDSKQNKGRKYRQSVISTMEMQESRDSLHNDSINSRRSTFVSNPGRPTIRFVKDPNFSRVSLNRSSVFDDLKGFLSEECDDTVIELSKLSIADSEREVTVLDHFHETERVTTARDYVLRRCNQTEPLLFDECYPETVLKNCHKIGEGVYGEVFLWRGRDGRARVMKIVPIAGTVKVNGEHQKDFHEIISEIVIAMELSALRAPIADIERQLDEGNDINALELHAIENATDIFNEVLAVRCLFGPYPSRLLDLWDLYDECKGSENDNPAALPVDQRYIVLELANAGQDLESYQFASAQQAHALFQQIAFGLAVAEEAFQFEHRDLHWGNVLIAPTEQKFATFVLRGRTYRVLRRGVAATVIDYSLSRLSLPLAGDSAALYNDLAADDQLFDAVGDYQFELYRLMRDKLGNDWKNFEPYTNILWLHYTVDKMITALRYKRTNTKIHKHYIEKLKGIKSSILEYGSAVQYVLTDIDF